MVDGFCVGTIVVNGLPKDHCCRYDWYQWYQCFFGFVQPLDPMVFEQATIGPDGFSMVAINHWSNDGSIIMDRRGLPSNVASLYFALKV